MAKPIQGVQPNRSMDLAVREINKDSRRVTVSFSSEQSVARWYGAEILQHDNDNVDVARLNDIGVSLFNHDRSYILGKIENARLDATEHRCYCDIVFDSDERADLIYQKVESGTLKGVSVGYSVDVWEEVITNKQSSNGRFTGPCYIATKWTPLEVSIVSVPADDSVGVGRELENNDNEGDEGQMALFNRRKNEPNFAPEGGAGGAGERAIPPVVTPPVINLEAERAAAVAAERTRTTEINALCRGFDIDPTAYINDGTDINAVRTAVLAVQMEKNKPTGGGKRTDDIQITKEEADKIREAASDGILLRAGVSVEKPADGARELRGLRLRDLAIDCLIRAGKTNVHRLDDNELLREALSPDSQFASILSSSANKSMSKAYNSANTTYQLWTGRGSLTDFKSTTHYQISEAGALEKITQAGEFKSDELIDNGVSKSLATFGKKWGFTRQALINDDLSILTKVPEKYSRSARRGINKLVYGMLGNNPTIYDSKAIFHADHSNLASVGAVINKDSVGAREAAMMTQKNLRGLEILNVNPKYMLIPVALKNTAKIFLKSGSDPDSLNPQIINPYQNAVEAIWDAELDGYSSIAWYLAASANDIDTIEVDYLNGDDMPKIESRLGFDFLGIEFRIYMDYGVTVLDYRGLQKNPGVAAE